MKYAAPLILFVAFVAGVGGFLGGRHTVNAEAVSHGVATWNPKPVSWIPEVVWKSRSDQPIFTSHLRASDTERLRLDR
jgi:hypothetical protein